MIPASPPYTYAPRRRVARCGIAPRGGALCLPERGAAARLERPAVALHLAVDALVHTQRVRRPRGPEEEREHTVEPRPAVAGCGARRGTPRRRRSGERDVTVRSGVRDTAP